MGIKTLIDPTIAQAVAHSDDWADAYITVFAPGTVFIEASKEKLEQNEGGQPQGAQYTAANTTGNSSPQRIRFIGTLYARGSIKSLQFDLTVFTRIPIASGTSQSGASVSRPRCR